MQFEGAKNLGLINQPKTPIIYSSYKTLMYQDWLKNVNSFLSLDISVHGTGYAMYKDGKMTYGRYALQAEGEVERVAEFRNWLLSLINNYSFEYYFIEDAIQSCNFKTVRALVSLNSVLDTLIYEQKVLPPLKLYRVSNKVWKKNLKAISGDLVVKGENYINGSDKDCTKACLESLGLSVEYLKHLKTPAYSDKQIEDICDAMGMALGTIAIEIAKAPVEPSKHKARGIDIRKGYKIRLYDDYDDADASCLRVLRKTPDRKIEYIDMTGNENGTDLVKTMAKALSKDPDAMYIVRVPVTKCCNVLLLKRLDTNNPVPYLLIYK